MTRSTQDDRREALDRPDLPLEAEERRELVRPAQIFTTTGKWKYQVWLQYEVADYDGWGGWDLHSAAETALARATRNGISEVVFEEVPPGWFMVVERPYGRNSYPIMVTGAPRSPETAQCPSMLAQDGELLVCEWAAPHVDNQSHSAMAKKGRAFWDNAHAVPNPWPVDKEPPPGIDVLLDTAENSNGQLFLCRVAHGWEWLTDLDVWKAAQGRPFGLGQRWHFQADRAQGTLKVVRP